MENSILRPVPNDQRLWTILNCFIQNEFKACPKMDIHSSHFTLNRMTKVIHSVYSLLLRYGIMHTFFRMHFIHHMVYGHIFHLSISGNLHQNQCNQNSVCDQWRIHFETQWHGMARHCIENGLVQQVVPFYCME